LIFFKTSYVKTEIRWLNHTFIFYMSWI